MLDLVILILLISGLFIGLKRGLILQFIHLTGFIIAFIVAKMYCYELAEKLVLWVPYPNINGNNGINMMFFQSENLELAYYRGIAFVLIFFVVKIVFQMIGSMLDFIAQLPFLRPINKLGGGFLGLLEVYLLVLIGLYIAALIPIESIQIALENSLLAEGIVKHTPLISQDIKDLWIGVKP